MMKSGVTLAALLCLFSVAKANDDAPVGMIFWGYLFSIFCFPFAILFVIRSEAKLIRYNGFLRHLSKNVKMIDANMPQIQDNFKVCHLHGTAIHPLMIINEDFGIFAQNVYRIKRTAQMYQWVQTVKTETTGSGSNRRTRTTYHYHKDWVSQMLDSSYYHHREGHDNPNINFPFFSEQQEADEVNLGLTFLKKDSIVQLGWKNEEVTHWTPEMMPQLNIANGKMMQANYGQLRPEGEYLVSQPNGWEHSTEIGRYRIQYSIYKCGEATVIGQQVQDERGLMTVRKYNPKKKMAAYSEDVNAETKQVWCGIDNKCACCFCICAEDCVNKGMEESVHYCQDGNMTIQEFSKSKSSAGLCTTFGRRLLGYILNAICLSFVMLPFVQFMCYNFVYRNIEQRNAGPLNSFPWNFIVAIPWTIFLSGIGIACETKALGGVVAFLGFVLMVVLFAIPSPNSC